MKTQGATWTDVNGVRVSISRRTRGPWRVNVGGRMVFEAEDRRDAGRAFSAIVCLLRRVFLGVHMEGI